MRYSPCFPGFDMTSRSRQFTVAHGPKNCTAPARSFLGIIFYGAILCTFPGLSERRTLAQSNIKSLALGRPPSIRLSYVDCEFPDDDEAKLDENGNILVGCRLIRTLLGLLVALIFFFS